MSRAVRGSRTHATEDHSHEGSLGTSEQMHQLQEAAAEYTPQIGAAAAVALAMAVINIELLPAVLIGAGATLAPKLLPSVGPLFRPLMKTALKGGYAAFAAAQQFAAEASEQMQDVIAEVQAEQRSNSRTHTRD